MRCLANLTSLLHLAIVGEDEFAAMEPPGAHAVAAVLAATPRLTHLNLCGSCADAECVRALVPAIGGLAALEELGLCAAFAPATDPVAIAEACAGHWGGLTALRS